MSALLGIGIGAVGHGGEPIPVYLTLGQRNQMCAYLGHPGSTFNPRLNETWCVCGERRHPGNQSGAHVACCGGPLDRHKAKRDGLDV